MQLINFINLANKEDFVLIELTDSFPYFTEKIIKKGGKETKDSKYHIANGLFSIYINFEIGISAEISNTPIFELPNHYECPIFITNVGTKDLEVRFVSHVYNFTIKPNEILKIYPNDELNEIEDRIEKEIAMSYAKIHKLKPNEINSLIPKGNLAELIS